ELKAGVLDGRKWFFYGSAVGELCGETDAGAAFDALFPYKEKKWQASQEEFYIHSHSVINW
ncbi:MAG: N-acetyltransferase, partial [Oscillospiraceae bacterium]|nr:N-acetyltransferase [Oscillospiraceae bacterium]